MGGLARPRTLQILGRMKLNGHVDPELIDIVVRERVCLRYAQQFLEPAQIDDEEVNLIPD